jgi:hypothetical protein
MAEQLPRKGADVEEVVVRLKVPPPAPPASPFVTALLRALAAWPT